MATTIKRLCGLMMPLIGTFTLAIQPAFTQTAATARVAKNTPPALATGRATLASHFDSTQMLRLTIGLKPPHMDEEEQFLQNLQDRNSPEFRHFLTADEWNARFAPSPEDEQAVVDWLQAQGLSVTQRWPNRLTVDVEGRAAVVEKAFSVTINNYQVNGVSHFSNDRDPVIPAALSQIVLSVGGMDNMQVLHPASKSLNHNIQNPIYVAGAVNAKGGSATRSGNTKALEAAQALASGKDVTPNLTNGVLGPPDLFTSGAYDFYALYNQGHCCNPLGNSGGSPVQTSIAIATAYQFDLNDINNFVNQYGLAYHLFWNFIDGTPTCCNDETTLDTEYSTAMSNSFGGYGNTSSVTVFEGANAHQSTFQDVYQTILNDNNTRVFSTSWGSCENDTADSQIAADHNIFNQMVGEGWSLTAAAGDSGAYCDGTNLSPGYPASDPDMVAAGGTVLSLSSTDAYQSETGWSGSTGGCSDYFAAPSFQASPYPASVCGSGHRSVPDISLNAGASQALYFNGTFYTVTGTSIVAPELAGFFAQENAYLLYMSTIIGSTGCWEGGSCYPLGNPNYSIYWSGANNAPHFPFYDITTGGNGYGAVPGFDLVTGWGSFNALQLARAMNWFIAADYGAPAITFSGPTTGHWYNTNQTVSYSIADTTADSHHANGVSGNSAAWDGLYSDFSREATPGYGNSFYLGPYYANSTSGSFSLSSAGQGCHTLYVQAWDNSGEASGVRTYGSVCYDTVPPVTSASLNGTFAGSQYDGPVQVTLSRTDVGSGVAATYYEVDGGGFSLYSSPFTVSSVGAHTVYFYSYDVAGNVESLKSISFTIRTVGAGALYFVPVTPCRVADTRNPVGPFGGPELGGGITRNFVVPSSACGIPSNAASYSLNFTVLPNAHLGYLTAWPAGQTQPGVSTLNSDGRVKANAAIVPAGTGGAISLYASDPTQVIIDIDGYFVEAGSSTAGLAFYTVTPCRLVDTRKAPSSLGGPFLTGKSSRQFPLLSGSCGIPNSAVAYSLNYTALPHQSLSYLTTWPSGQTQPVVSTLNAPTGTTTANAAIVPAGTGGNVSVYVSNDSDLLIDVNGYFAAPSSTGLSLYPVTPCRALDTRNSGGQFSGDIAVNIVGSGCNIPSRAQAYVLNATVVPPAALTYLTLWPNGQTQPAVSTLNAPDGAITSNMALVPTTNGLINAYASNATQLILDISSYFAQ